MAYNLTNWKDQIVSDPTKYKITKENGTQEIVNIERAPQKIIQQGTRITADKLNNIEKGIKGAADLVSDLAGEGRTEETVKKNADDIGKVSTQMAELTDEIATHKAEKAHYPVRQPTSFQGSPDDGAVNLSWTNPNNLMVKDINNNDIILAEFKEVEVKRDGSIIYTGTAENFTDTGLTNYQEYTYEIISVTTGRVRSEPATANVTPVPYTMDYAVGVNDLKVIGATELGSQVQISWTDPTDTSFAGVLIRRSETTYPATINEGVEVYNGTGESVTDTGLVNEQTYFYTIWAYSINNEYSDEVNKKTGSAKAMQGQDESGSPGSAVLIAGDTSAGYFGTVLSSDLVDGSTLASQIGLSAGISQHSTTDWLKFMIDGKVIFSPMKPFRYNLSWNDINSANAVYGEKTIEIDGLTYKVRLWHGAENNPSNYTDADRDAIGSEWNRLMLPIHIDAPSSWAYPDYGGTTEDWGINFTDEDLLTHYDFGNGSYSWCQETRGDDCAYRVIRGASGVSSSNSSAASISITGFGWRPCLELAS